MFVFTLQPLLELRRREEDAARAEFARWLAAETGARATLATLEGSLQRTGSAAVVAASLQYVAAQLEARAGIVARTGAALARAQRGLRAARAAYKAVEVLRDRRRAEFESGRRRREQRALDESNAGLRPPPVAGPVYGPVASTAKRAWR
ncbi:MAG TPA: flagellar export protein FliJ [Candidatus Tumulicola sp.]